jgi:DNA-binding NtrC family response regulator
MRRPSPIRVLVVTEDRDLSDVLCDGIAVRGYSPVPAGSLDEGLEQIEEADYEVALVDLALPGGVDLIRRLADEDLSTESVVVREPDACPLEAMRMGAYGCVTRPPRAEELDVLLARAAEKSHLRRENLSLQMRLRWQEAVEPLVTRDASMRELLSTLERAASAESPVLVRGEMGTGRRLVARALHRSSPRASAPFVPVNCRLVPTDQLEDELFGHEKGAFAGAHARKPGLLELAESGVAFLQEVERASPRVQAKLLRVIEAREMLRVGAIRPAPCDVRIVAGTSEDLRAQVREGRFREDLCYRLSTVTLELPPLRERKGDIPLLALHFLERLAGHGKRTLSPGALCALQAYSWPGNVRELRMVVERAAMLGAGEVLEPDDLPLEVREPGCAALRPGLTLEEMERQYIVAMLRRNEGHRGRTARDLGIDPKTLYNKLGPERPRRRKNIPV